MINNKVKQKGPVVNLRRRNALTLFACLIFGLFMFAPKKSQACCSCLLQAYTLSGPFPFAAGYPPALPAYLQSWIKDLHIDSWINVIAKIGGESDHVYSPISAPIPPFLMLQGPVGHRKWMENVLYEGKDPLAALVKIPGVGFGFEGAMDAMANHLKSVATQQTLAFGMFLDAKNQMETQETLRTLTARAHKDYQTTTGVCEMATHIKTLAASEEKNVINKQYLSGYSKNVGLASANIARDNAKKSFRKDAKLLQYKTKFCDPADNNGNLNAFCRHGDKVGSDNIERRNKDIDFIRTLEMPWTVNVDFSDATLTHHEEEILALKDNIYKHELISPIGYIDISNFRDSRMSGMQETFMDMRALLAKNSVAKNSFNALAAMKSTGAPGAKDFVVAVMKNLLGGSDPEQSAIFELTQDIDDPNQSEFEPSYYAQMEILTKKLVQNPKFYTDLMDKPANITRKKVGLQAIGLMQKFDLFKSHLRNEANLSVLLELAVTKMQTNVENELIRGEERSVLPGAPTSNVLGF